MPRNFWNSKAPCITDAPVSSPPMTVTKFTLPRCPVTETMRCPALGSTATNSLALPLRTYSKSCLVGLEEVTDFG